QQPKTAGANSKLDKTWGQRHLPPQPIPTLRYPTIAQNYDPLRYSTTVIGAKSPTSNTNSKINR
ncbi:hypothetical protein, partial [Ochrobactrum sp. 3-3]|uniref:hypothetical protein n=1 Tax=Ochrobactrum sp. 3-3 TaxID=1830124 RepID=UPI00196356CE